MKKFLSLLLLVLFFSAGSAEASVRRFPRKIAGSAAKKTITPLSPQRALLFSQPVTSISARDKDALQHYLKVRFSEHAAVPGSIRLLLNRVNELADREVVEKTIFNRLEFLAEKREAILAAYQQKINSENSLRDATYSVTYMSAGHLRSSAQFDKDRIVPVIESKLLRENTLMKETLAILGDKFLKSGLYSLDPKKEDITIYIKKTANQQSISKLYKLILGCTSARPCHYIFDKEGTVRVYGPDEKYWLRVGMHEVSSFPLHLHLNTNVELDVISSGIVSKEKVIANYKINLDGVFNLVSPEGTPLMQRFSSKISKGKMAKIRYEQNSMRYRFFIKDALKAMQEEGTAIPFTSR